MGDRVLAAVVAVVSGLYLVATARLPVPPLGDPVGQKTFPALIGIAGLVAGVLLAIEIAVRRRAATAVPAAPRARPAIVAAILAWTLAYVVAFEPVGYLAATFVYLFGLLTWFYRTRAIRNALLAAGFALAVHGVFTGLLGINLPGGVLDF